MLSVGGVSSAAPIDSMVSLTRQPCSKLCARNLEVPTLTKGLDAYSEDMDATEGNEAYGHGRVGRGGWGSDEEVEVEAEASDVAGRGCGLGT